MKPHTSISSTSACDEKLRDIEDFDWQKITDELHANGSAIVQRLLTREQCQSISERYEEEEGFRKRVVMEKHGFGRGEYKYFSYPLPELLDGIRTAVYPKLVPVANAWNEAMKIAVHFPDTHREFLQRCHQSGQMKPTPLILKYKSGDYNCLHQDLYGEHVFPLQLAILLSEPDHDFTGGEFVLTEQRPRMQSRVNVIPLNQGDAVIFAVHNRPAKGSKGFYKVNMRHGVSPLQTGERFTAGVIFHDAT